MPVRKVTDPTKKVTDPLVLKHLAKQGIDKDYVEFWHDYAPRSRGKEYSPYAKFYRDLKSNKRFMVVSTLPMVNADGVRVEVAWDKVGNTYRTKPNQFSAAVTGRRVTLNCVNDQPWGARKGETVSWQPQLFLNDVEVSPASDGPTLLESDPVNENYHNNVLEWDYGICRRRIRIIEGRFRERWIFPADPGGDVRIKHNLAGSLKLRLGYAKDASGEPLQVSVIGDEEIIRAGELAKAVFPVEIGAEETFYPDADPETSSVDGKVIRFSADPGLTWADIRDGAGTHAYPSAATEGSPAYFASRNTTNQWGNLQRSIFLFDTSALPDAPAILGAVLSLFGYAKQDQLAITPDANIYSSNPDTNTDLIPADYQSLGTTPFSTAIAYAVWITTGYNDFTLNADGLAAISKTGVSKYGARNANYDVADQQPAWSSGKSSYLFCYYSEQGNGYKPKLVVTYASLPDVDTDPATLVETSEPVLNATLVDDGGEACGSSFEWGETEAYGNVTPVQQKGPLVELENFIPYTEVDPNSRLAVTANRVTFSGLQGNEDAYVYSDKGVDYFDGDIQALFTILVNATPTNGSQTIFFNVANLVDDAKGIMDAGGDALWVKVLKVAAPTPLLRLYLAEVKAGTLYESDYYGLSYDTPYYLKLVRDESVGTYGTLYLYIYSDAARTILLETRSLTLHAKLDFRYIYTIQSWNQALSSAMSGYHENLQITFPSGAFSQALSGLKRGTTYHFRAKATNSAGTGYGSDQTFTPPPKATTDPATEVGQTTVTINGTLDDDGGEACDCYFEYGETTDYGTTTATQSKSTGETFSQEVRGLNPSTTYHFRAVATNSAGTSYGADRTFRTSTLSAEAHQALGKSYPLSRAEV